MNKKILPAALVVLPVVAMMAAFAPNAVRYLYPDGEFVYMTYFGMVEEVKTAVCMPASVIAIGICIFLAVAYAFSGKQNWLKAVAGPSFIAALLAVMPYLMPDDIKAFPSVIVPIAMMVEWLMAYQMGKTTDSTSAEKAKGRRLS